MKYFLNFIVNIDQLKIYLIWTLIALPALTFGETESKTWIGSGTASGRYIEKNNQIDQELSGDSNELVIYHRKGDWGITTGVGFLESKIDQKFNDSNGFTHEINYRNISGYLLLGLKLKILFANISGHGVVGMGETTFQKKYFSSNGNYISYPIRKAQSLITGSEGMVFFDLEDNWIIGGKVGTYNRNLDLQFGSTDAKIIQDKNYLLFVGVDWGGNSSKKGK